MKEIKFRAYHKKRETMCHFDIMTITKTYYLGYWHTADLDGFDCELDDKMLYSDLMQYTGLKDKNGKEIYEGDIVTIPGEYPYFDCGTPNYVAEVDWIFAGFQTVLHCINGEKRGISEGINEPLEDGDYFEVIGNIYENPELLK